MAGDRRAWELWCWTEVPRALHCSASFKMEETRARPAHHIGVSFPHAELDAAGPWSASQESARVLLPQPCVPWWSAGRRTRARHGVEDPGAEATPNPMPGPGLQTME